MAHRQQRRAEKQRRHAHLHRPAEPPGSGPDAPASSVVVREADRVVRLAYTRTQAAQALGVSRSTLRRLLPYLETIEMPWGTRLIPVDVLERLLAQRRRAAPRRMPRTTPGRPAVTPPELVERLRLERAAGKSLGQIAQGLNADATPTAHGGARWWPSTVRAVLSRSSSLPSA